MTDTPDSWDVAELGKALYDDLKATVDELRRTEFDAERTEAEVWAAAICGVLANIILRGDHPSV